MVLGSAQRSPQFPSGVLLVETDDVDSPLGAHDLGSADQDCVELRGAPGWDPFLGVGSRFEFSPREISVAKFATRTPRTDGALKGVGVGYALPEIDRSMSVRAASRAVPTGARGREDYRVDPHGTLLGTGGRSPSRCLARRWTVAKTAAYSVAHDTSQCGDGEATHVYVGVMHAPSIGSERSFSTTE